jgi:transcriptional repressor NrdR
MVCIYCRHETQVVNSRHQKKANQVWRRRRCVECSAVFSTLEAPDTTQALRVMKSTGLEPFSRDNLLLSIYDSLKHRKTAMSDATALTSTVIIQLFPLIKQAVVDREEIVQVTSEVLRRFDKVAATHYRAFHPTTHTSQPAS